MTTSTVADDRESPPGATSEEPVKKDEGSSLASDSDDSASAVSSTGFWASASQTFIVSHQRQASIIVPPTKDDDGDDDASSDGGDLDDNENDKNGGDDEAPNGEDHLGNAVIVSKAKRKLPPWLVNIYTYCILVSFIELWYYFYLAYTVAVMTSIEKRYGWPSIFSGLFLASFEIGHVTIVIFSFTETNINIPRRLAVRGFFMAFGSLLAAAPHFLITVPSDNARNNALEKSKNFNNSNSTGFGLLNCFKLRSDGLDCSNASLLAGDDLVDSSSENSSALTALILLVFAQVVVATASSTYHVVGVMYIDNNVDKSKSSTLIGVVYSMMMLGPAGAFFFASWMAGSVYVHLSDPNPPEPDSADFVGAWWVGFVLCAVMFAISAPFFFLFPRKLDRKHHHHHHHHHHNRSRSRTNSDKVGSRPTSVVEERKLMASSDGDSDEIGDETFTIQSIPKNFVILFRNTAFLALVFMACMHVYFLAGYFTFFPKYLESMYQQTTQAANFVSGIANPIPCALGTFLGGWLMAKLKLTKSTTLVYTFFFTLVVTIGLGVLSTLGCQEGHDIVGANLNGNATAYCGCSNCPAIYQPVCRSDGITFLSPCLAGCQRLNTETGMFSHCGCPGPSGNGSMLLTAQSGRCEDVLIGASAGTASRCLNFYIYNVLAFFLAVVIFLPATPLTIIMMRVVGEKYKSWAVGLTSSFCSLLGFVPGPVLYGALFDSHCIYWEDMVQSEPSSAGSCQNSLFNLTISNGTTTAAATTNSSASQHLAMSATASSDGPRHCAIYETTSLAVWFHLMTGAFLLISLPANVYAWWICREQDRLDALKAKQEQQLALLSNSNNSTQKPIS